MTTEVNHADLTGSSLHPPMGTSLAGTPLDLPDVDNAIRIRDSANSYDVATLSLQDDEFVIGSASRPIALKVYDPGTGANVNVLSGSIVAPRKFSTTVPTGTLRWLLNFEGNLNDSSGNGYHATLGGTAGGVARYPYYVGPGGAVRGFLFDGQTWLTRSLTGAAALEITGAITIEILLAPMQLQMYNYTDVWLAKYGVLVACSNSSSTGTPLQYARYVVYNGAYTDASHIVRWGHANGATSYLLDDNNVLMPGALQVLTVTRDSAGTALKIYLNGYEVASTTVGGATGGTSPDQVSVGANVTATADDRYTFTGFMASLRITDAEFSAAQVLSEARSAMGWAA